MWLPKCQWQFVYIHKNIYAQYIQWTEKIFFDVRTRKCEKISYKMNDISLFELLEIFSKEPCVTQSVFGSIISNFNCQKIFEVFHFEYIT